MSCSICNNNITNDKITLKCKHELHYNCMIQYLRIIYYGTNNYKITCPTCNDITDMYNIPIPDIIDNNERFNILIGEFNECKIEGCCEKEVIGNEGYCNIHNQKYSIYTPEMYDLTFYWIYTICKHSTEERKRNFFDVVLKLIKKHSFNDSNEITNYILTSLGEDKYNITQLYQKTGIVQDSVIE